MKSDNYQDDISQKAVKALANELGSRLKRDIGDEVEASLGQFLETLEESPAKTLRETCAKQDQVLELLNGRLHSSESAKAEIGQELEKLKEKVTTTLMEKAEAEARKEKVLEEKAKAEGLRQSLFDEKTEAEEALARSRARSAKESDELKARIQSIQNELAETTELAETRSREKAEAEARVEKTLEEKEKAEELRHAFFDEKTAVEEALTRVRARSAKESDELKARIQSIQNDLAESEKEFQETDRINLALKARVKSYGVSRAVAIILMSISLAVAGYTTFTGQGYPDQKRGADRRVEELNAMLEKKNRVIGELSREQNRLTARAENLNKQLSRQAGRPAPPSESKEVTYRTSTVVYFTLGSIGLSEQGAAKVRILAEKIKTMPGVLVQVEGHTDNKPLGWTSKVKHNDNKGLSTSRASVAARLLIEAGVDASRISIVGLGDHRPIVPNDSPENRDKNRRVEIKVAGNGGI